MAVTPEGAVKQKVREVLDRYPAMYYHMPVLSGYGRPSLDFIGCYNKLFFSIETKVSGKELTQRQQQTKGEMETAGGAVFVVTDAWNDPGLHSLILWLEANRPPHDHSYQPSAQSRRTPL